MINNFYIISLIIIIILLIIIKVQCYFKTVEEFSYGFKCLDVITTVTPSISSEINGDYEIFKFIHDGSGENTVYNFTLNKSIVADILIVGGGGGGGYGGYENGGGGGGGVLYMVDKLLQDTTYKITVGDGGATNVSGYDSSITLSDDTNIYYDDIPLIGKGGGTRNANGGSGGGGANRNGNRTPGNSSQGLTFWNGTQYVAGGFNGAQGGSFNGGGGGGAGAVGQRNGGNGREVNITGVSLYYGGGGAGSPGGLGGLGGGGRVYGWGTNGQPGESHTGGGGGAHYSWTNDHKGGKGGSGIVIIRKKSMYNPCNITKILVDNIDVSAEYNDDFKKIILGNNDGSDQKTYEVNFINDMKIDILIVGGGGGGHGGRRKWAGGGGGGGGILYANDLQVPSGIYTFKVGRGGKGEKTVSGVLTPPEDGFASEALGAIANGGDAGRKVAGMSTILYGGRGGTTNTAFTIVSPTAFNRYKGGIGGNPRYWSIETPYSISGADGHLIDIVGSYYWSGGGGGGGSAENHGDGGNGGGAAGGFLDNGDNGPAIGGDGINNGENTSSTIQNQWTRSQGGNGGELTGGGGGGAFEEDGGNGGSGSIIIVYKCSNNVLYNPCAEPVNSILVDSKDVSLPYINAYRRIILRNYGSNRQETYQVNFLNNMKIDILIVGGGGGGMGGTAGGVGGGGGGGGILYGSDLQVSSGIYTFKVGRGGRGLRMSQHTNVENGRASEAFGAIAYGGSKGKNAATLTQWYGGAGGTTNTSSATVSLTAYNGGNGGTGTWSTNPTTHSLSGVDGHLIDIVGSYYWGGGGAGGGWYNQHGNGGKGGGGGGGFFDNGFYDPSWGGTGINNGATKLGGKYGNSVSGGNGGELTGGGGGGAFEEDGGDGGSGSIIIVYKCME
jgi:hypothetical protein